MLKNISNISKEELVLFYRLEKIIIELAPIKSDFRLYQLAYFIDYPTIKTSKLIKKIYGCNFNNVINYYRLKYFDDLLLHELIHNKKINITDLIKKSGFYSRNTYYKSLKNSKLKI